jgi:RNA polymerase sigma-70 factor (ECF subfamily)
MLSSLPKRQRDIVEAISIEGRSARDVGVRLGMSEGAVRVALHRALKALAVAYRGERS